MRLATLIIIAGIIALSTATVPPVRAQEGEVTINPSDDTYIDFSNQYSNYGGQTSLYIEKYNESNLIGERKIWLKFNLSSIPDGAIIDTATLRLYCLVAAEAFNISACSSSDISWTESALTWSSMPSYNDTSMDTEQVATPYRWYNWSVTYAVQEAVDGVHGGPDSVTVILQETSFRNPSSSVLFYSKDGIFNYPELTVHWSDVVPEFSSFLMVVVLFASKIVVLFATIIHKKSKNRRSTDRGVCHAANSIFLILILRKT